MSVLRRAVAILAITLLASLGAKQVWSIEIDCIQGRPWDSGYVEFKSNFEGRPVFERDPNYRITKPEYEAENRANGEKSFEDLLYNLISFLNP